MSELPRQKQPKFYRPNGAIYIVKKDIVMKERTFYTKNTFAYFMPRENSIDIDTLFDLKFAEVILLEKRKGKT
jgi:CMP-N-acetylneuraminic acid synthetase